MTEGDGGKEEMKFLHKGGRDQSMVVQEVLADLKLAVYTFANMIIIICTSSVDC